MAKKESVLTQAEKDSFEIESFIFHILRKDKEAPIFLDEVVLKDEQKEFFKDRFAEVSEGVQHEFINKDNNTTFDHCKTLLNCDEKKFIEISKKLASEFKKLHGGTTSNGVFVISRVKVLGGKKLIFLLKIDDKKVYQYDIEDNKKAYLKEITNTFVEDSKAIQKAALIDPTDDRVWDVLAFDKNPSGLMSLTLYFTNFLQVKESDTPSSLTPKTVTVAHEWAIANKGLLGLKEHPTEYKQKAIRYLQAAAKFDAVEFIDSLIGEDLEGLNLNEFNNKKTQMFNSFKHFLDERGLSGQNFRPSLNSITNRYKRNTSLTKEGVKIEWFGSLEENNISISDKKDNDGNYVITIKTTKIDS